MQKQKQHNRNTIKPLTSLRFIFAVMVFLHHTSFVMEGNSTTLKWWYTHIFSEGYIGVNFFFILSGFILAYNYQERFLQNKITKSKFWVARIARIYPLHLLTLILSVPLMFKKIWVGNKLIWIAKFFINLFLLQSIIPSEPIYMSFNRPAWSISDEFFFYLAFPFLIVFLVKKIQQNSYNIYWIILSLSLIPVLMFLIPEGWHHHFFYVNPFFRLVDFTLGILLFIFYEKIERANWNLNFNILEVLSFIVLIVFFILHPHVPAVWRYSSYYWFPMCFLILTLAFQGGIFSKILSLPSLILLGEISFGFYLFHWLVLSYFENVNQHFFNLQNGFIIIFITFSISLVLSYFSYFWFEQPANRWIKNRFEKIKPQNP